MQNITTIFFDFGGVLTQKGEIFSFLELCEKKYSKPIAFINPESKEIWDKASVGLLPSSEYWNLLGKYFETDPKLLLKDCIENDGFNYNIYELIIELSLKYKLGMISNIIKDWFETADGVYNFTKYFDEVITSYESGIVKPNKEIYEIALKKIGANVSECLFIDDNEKNILTAKEIGIIGILFKDVDQLKIELKGFGVDI